MFSCASSCNSVFCFSLFIFPVDVVVSRSLLSRISIILFLCTFLCVCMVYTKFLMS